MPRESKSAKRERAQAIYQRLDERYGNKPCPLDFAGDPFRLTIATLLSAQTTDKNVNRVTPELWRRYPTVQDLAGASLADVEEIVHPLGFYRSKAANCIKCAQAVLTEFDGVVPCTIAELTRLPGVGRKTANVVMAEGFGVAEGIAVDTHVFRIAHQLGFSRGETPVEVERDLMDIFPKEQWINVNKRWVLFGREVCDARKPQCGVCPLADLCPSKL